VPLSVHERPYRGVFLEVGPETEAQARGAGRTVRVLYARSTREVEERLATLRETLGSAIVLLLLLTGPLAGLLAWRALAPVRRLEREAGGIGSESLGARLDLDGVPGDLASLASAVNSMLDRIEGGFERERRLAQDAAHELRTPVASLKAAIQAALLNPRDAEEDRRALGDLLEDVRRLEGLCEALLLTADPAGRAARPRSPAEELGPRVAAAAEAFRARAVEGGGTLRIEVPGPPPGAPAVAADDLAVRRIITNLVDNSLRHGGPGVDVAVSLRWDPAGAAVSVEDDGAGVPPGLEERLFERFFRADGARARATGGAGLGLALCRGVAGAAGGTVAFERPAGRGCRFLWRIPFAEAPATGAAAGP
jgi:signal transduction histidine kinase